MDKYRRSCLIISIVCFAIATICIFGIASLANAGMKDCVALQRYSHASYLELKEDCSAHVYWATYDITYNHGSIKTHEGTHNGDYIRPENRPPRADADGNLTPEWLKWLATLKYTHLEGKGDKLILMTNQGLDKISRTHKEGKWYYYIWSSDEKHDLFVNWCEKNGIKRNQ